MNEVLGMEHAYVQKAGMGLLITSVIFSLLKVDWIAYAIQAKAELIISLTFELENWTRPMVHLGDEMICILLL